MLTEGIFIHNSHVTKVHINSIKVYILNKQHQFIGVIKMLHLKIMQVLCHVGPVQKGEEDFVLSRGVQ